MQLSVFMRQQNFFLALSKLSANFLSPFFFLYGKHSTLLLSTHIPMDNCVLCPLQMRNVQTLACDLSRNKRGVRHVLSQLFWHMACKCSLSSMELHMEFLKLLWDSCAVILLPDKCVTTHTMQ